MEASPEAASPSNPDLSGKPAKGCGMNAPYTPTRFSHQIGR